MIDRARDPRLQMNDAQHVELGHLIQTLLVEVYRAPSASLPMAVRKARAALQLEAAKVVEKQPNGNGKQ